MICLQFVFNFAFFFFFFFSKSRLIIGGKAIILSTESPHRWRDEDRSTTSRPWATKTQHPCPHGVIDRPLVGSADSSGGYKAMGSYLLDFLVVLIALLWFLLLWCNILWCPLEDAEGKTAYGVLHGQGAFIVHTRVTGHAMPLPYGERVLIEYIHIWIVHWFLVFFWSYWTIPFNVYPKRWRSFLGLQSTSSNQPCLFLVNG